MLAKYGPFKNWKDHIDIEALMCKVNREIIYYIQEDKANGLLWRTTTQFYKTLISMNEVDDEGELLNEKESAALRGLNTNQSADSDTIELASGMDNTKFNKNLVDIFYGFKIKMFNNLKNKPLRILRENENLANLCVENKELEAENSELKLRLKELEMKNQEIQFQVKISFSREIYLFSQKIPQGHMD